MNSVQTAVAEKITTLGPAVMDKVVTTLTDRELKRRAEALTTCIDALEKLEAEQKKFGPDQKTFDETGKALTETFSKARLDERNKMSGKIAKLTGAITKALDKQEFGDVYNFAKSGGKPADDDQKPSEPAAE